MANTLIITAVNMDTMTGRDFAAGLAELTAAAEQT